MGGNEQRLLTSQILQDGTVELFGCNSVLSLQKREEGSQRQLRGHQGCHSHSRPRVHRRGEGGKGRAKAVPKDGTTSPKESHSLGFSPKPQSAATWDPADSQRATAPHSLGDDIATPVGLEDKVLSHRGFFSGPDISWNLSS